MFPSPFKQQCLSVSKPALNVQMTQVILTNVTFSSGINCECTATTSITIGPGAKIESGATVTFKAPTIKLQSGFYAEKGVVVNIKQQ